MEVTIVIPTFNGKGLIEKNLPKVTEAMGNIANGVKEITVVDDGSKDETVEFLKKNFPQVRLIRHKRNLGFPASVNSGVKEASTPLIALLNSDVSPSANFLESALPHFENKKVFAVSLNEEGKSLTWTKGHFKDGFVGWEPGPKDRGVHETFWVSGGSGVFRKSIWDELGGMDEALFSPFYWEDLDICYRAAKRGYQLLWEPGAKVEHKHESTIGLLPQKYVETIRERNQLLFIWKNLTSPNLFKRHLIGLIKRCLGHPGYIRIVLAALPKLGAVLDARKRELKEGRVSDEAIFART
ncbi:hypothetical protein A2115_03460 [Candidatus Woesebacteria bacterium GWA1_41_8]|uniref:Glycosyltransferase 2-like domain-containing protein n=1 Tax=Candidatus Woesebacteria bacterium GWA1_41_8 TaxID=1802471 RepID=A0A1F7WJZ1_9BACT|nr:MAG: hypothetical protein A2115_03460 [Candidatus Woesebacteria bacterium GWA1_41_8]